MAVSTTHRQRELLDYIKLYIDRTGGIAPSFEEMRQAINMGSKAGISALLTSLEQRGKIVRIRHRDRAIRILPDDPFDGIPSHMLIAELARRGETACMRRKAA